MAAEGYFNSKFFTCEEIDKRLLQGLYDDVVKSGYKGTKEELYSKLAFLVGKKTVGEIFNDYENNIADGSFTHAEGYRTKASGSDAHAEGNQCQANGNFTHAEGNQCQANGNASHVEGNKCQANGNQAHAEGNTTKADGPDSHSEGYETVASASFSHSANRGTVADNYAQTSIGYFNEKDTSPSSSSYNNTKPAFLIGNGQSDESRGNAFKVLFNGQTFSDGQYSSSGADYAEMFEWKDKNPDNEDRVGLFVTLESDKIKLTQSTDTYILGIISAAPTIIGDNPMRWHNKYLNDEWGRPVYEGVTVHYTEIETLDGIEKEVEKTRVDRVRKLNPDFNPEEKYIPRSERQEWDYVGVMGKLLVKHDGTLIEGSFCKPGNNGVATKSSDKGGYYVMKVINNTQALIFFK